VTAGAGQLGAAAPARPSPVSGEPVLLRTRPGLLFVFIYRQGWWLIPPLLMVGVYLFLRHWLDPDPLPRLPMLAIGWIIVGFICRILAWSSRDYVLTTQRLLVTAGVIRRVRGEVPLRNIQHTTVTQSALERLCGLGTIGIATAGSGGAAINWLMVPRPIDALDRIRQAARPGPDASSATAHPLTSLPPAPAPRRLRVIGLAGGIGSGKSEVAAILQQLGAVVIDSDRLAKEALNLPDVRDQLVGWWGQRILGPDGRVSRSTVADIIFSDPAQRARLESLVHPIVGRQRAVLRARAQERGAAAVVIDAPLLFEAGVDRECDAVIFVDAPRDIRLARVKASRGWDEAELNRRESSQLPLDEKRRRSSDVVANAGSAPDELARAVEPVFRRLVSGR
jgi:dephospho-CoA kinase